MKKTNGFTLIELMGVVAILALLALIGIPVVEKHVNKGKREASEIQISNIELAAKSWVSDNKVQVVNYFANCEKTDETIPCNTLIVSLKDLIDSGYIDNETLEDPVTGKQIDLDNSYVEITYVTKKNYNYEVKLKNAQ